MIEFLAEDGLFPEAPKCGATGTGSPEYFLPRLMEETLGAKFSIVTGYPRHGASSSLR
jgi:hypothetical protein